jgi:hypothetical protein
MDNKEVAAALTKALIEATNMAGNLVLRAILEAYEVNRSYTDTKILIEQLTGPLSREGDAALTKLCAILHKAALKTTHKQSRSGDRPD